MPRHFAIPSKSRAPKIFRNCSANTLSTVHMGGTGLTVEVLEPSSLVLLSIFKVDNRAFLGLFDLRSTTVTPTTLPSFTPAIGKSDWALLVESPSFTGTGLSRTGSTILCVWEIYLIPLCVEE